MMGIRVLLWFVELVVWRRWAGPQQQSAIADALPPRALEALNFSNHSDWIKGFSNHYD
jgi:hypothetical protein